MIKPKNAARNNLEKTLDRLSGQKKAPIVFYIVLVVLYLAASVTVSLTASRQGDASAGGNTIPIYAFAGVFTALANICIIFMVLFYRKLGYYTSIFFLMMQMLMITRGILLNHNLASLPGLFTDLFTVIACVILYANSKRVEKYQARIREQAVTDLLTGLPNRFAGSELVDELVRKGEKFTYVSIDLNNFKSINSTMGHHTGNAVLGLIAERWKNLAESGVTGTNDFVTRQGGDEFSLIIRGYHTEGEMLRTIQRYDDSLIKSITYEDCDYFITASFGYAQFPKSADNADTLQSNADAAMYEVKRLNSGNHVMGFSPELLRLDRSLEIERKIRKALDDDSIYFNLQPQYNIKHELRGFEALARIKDEDGSQLAPSDFIPVAEQVGLIDQVDLVVFRKSADFFGTLIHNTGAELTLSVNASVRHLMKNGFLDEIREIIESNDIPPHQLEIEITESVMIDSAEKALQCISEIKDMGIKIAIDDFGTGYSSLSYLNNFPADLIKIDKSFIDKMNTSDSSRQYVAAIISMGHVMHFQVISEGVEKPDQLETLRSIGCDYIQGFIWGRPLEADDAGALVMEQLANY